MIPVPVLNNRVYDFLKYIAQIVLPAFGALYYGLAQVWGLPEADKVVGSIIVIDTFLGALLNLSSKAYNSSDAKFDGSINVVETPEKKMYSLVVDGDPADLDKKDEAVFKVNKEPLETPIKVKKKAAPRKTAS